MTTKSSTTEEGEKDKVNQIVLKYLEKNGYKDAAQCLENHISANQVSTDGDLRGLDGCVVKTSSSNVPCPREVIQVPVWKILHVR